MTINDKKSNREEISVHKGALSCSERDIEIAELAYSKAENRGFEPGHEMDDWLQAEQEISTDVLS